MVEDAKLIDGMIQKESDLARALDFLARTTLPSNPLNPDNEVRVRPFYESLDNQLWRWNRVASRFAEKRYSIEAAEVQAALYFAIIALQIKYKQRFHKGMPLCNVGYFGAGRTAESISENKEPSTLQRTCWLLGLAEDAFTNAEGVRESINYRNLVTTGYSPPAVDQYISTLDDRFAGLRITPIMPEVVPDFWRNPLGSLPSPDALNCVDQLIEITNKSYPKVPPNPLEALRKSWAFLDKLVGG